MMKTANDIERYFYQVIKEGVLGQSIAGSVYRSEMRPDDADTEDVVVKFMSGVDGQIQTGIVILNVYVKDILNGERMTEDKGRVGELEELILEIPDEFAGSEYRVWTETTPFSVAVEGINQHVVAVRLQFKLLTD